jgi:hypothetical protein
MSVNDELGAIWKEAILVLTEFIQYLHTLLKSISISFSHLRLSLPGGFNPGSTST